MIIASFDLATQTGVAVGKASGDPLCFSESLGTSGEHHGFRFAACQLLVDKMIADHSPDLVSIESPVYGIKESSKIPGLLIGLRGCVLSVCCLRGVPCVEYDVKTIRKSFIGKGNLPTKEAKAAVIYGCELRGWNVEDDNAADAAALWDYTRAIRKFKSLTPLELSARGK